MALQIPVYPVFGVWIRLPTNQGLKLVCGQIAGFAFYLSESDFQQIKDWNISSPILRSASVIVWIRLPTNQGLKPGNGIALRGAAMQCLNPTSNKSRIETKHSKGKGTSPSPSESDFQQIKDWNRDRKYNIPGWLWSESDFQQIKDWNFFAETYRVVFDYVWIRLPTNQGLKPNVETGTVWQSQSLNPTSNKSRIETPTSSVGLESAQDVWIRLPTNQGLKRDFRGGKTADLAESESDFQQIKDWNFHQIHTISSNYQSLNPTSNKSRIETHIRDSVCAEKYRLNPTSNKSRIETGSGAGWLIDYIAVWIRLPTNQGLKPNGW